MSVNVTSLVIRVIVNRADPIGLGNYGITTVIDRNHAGIAILNGRFLDVNFA